MKSRCFYVYFLTNRHNTVLYIGMTNNIQRRLMEHRQGVNRGFTKRYNVTKLVYLETFGRARAALAREKQLKKWHRAWKLALIHKENPLMEDLAPEVQVV